MEVIARPSLRHLLLLAADLSCFTQKSSQFCKQETPDDVVKTVMGLNQSTIGSDLLTRLREQESSAYEEMIALFGPPVLATCQRILINEQDAQDAAQECFVEVFLSIRKFRGEAGLKTWMLKIATRKSIDQLRKRRSRGKISRWFMGIEDAPQEALKRPDGLGSDHTEDPLDLEQKRQLLQKALDKLAPRQRVALTLCSREGFSQREAAELMGTSESALESLLHRAKRNLESSFQAAGLLNNPSKVK